MRPGRNTTCNCRSRFQSTHPHGVRHGRFGFRFNLAGFNPRTRTGCDLARMDCQSWSNGFNPRTRTGCDDYNVEEQKRLRVSIHAPARGATFVDCAHNRTEIVSIHAPARGATGRKKGIRRCHGCFNPRTRTGCDISSPCFIHAEYMFQSTHPHGVRQKIMTCSETLQSFNPRTRTGCDKKPGRPAKAE